MALATAACGLWLLSGVAPASAQITISAPTLDATGATYTMTWPGGSAAWAGGYSDGTSFQSGTQAPPLAFRLPYHPSGAAPAWFCGAGSCDAFTVPAKPVASSTHTVEYREPSTNADATPLADLASIRAYWRLDNGAEQVTIFPVSGPTGGAQRQASLVVPAISGTLTVAVTAVDTSGNESARSTPASKVIGGGKPLPAGAGTLNLTR